MFKLNKNLTIKIALIISSAIIIFLLFNNRHGILNSFRKDKVPEISRNIDKLFVIFYKFDKVKKVTPSEDLSNCVFAKDNLIIKKGNYQFNGQCYNFTEEGLYIVVNLEDNRKQQYIVYDSNLFVLMSSISWLIAHGNIDNESSFIELTMKAKADKLILTCYFACNFAKSILDSLQFSSRILAGISLDEWNGFDDGHNMIEVYSKKYKKWIVFDIDMNSYFVINDVPLSFIELTRNLYNDSLLIKSLSNDVKLDSSYRINNIDFSFYLEYTFNNQLDWYRRVLKVPLIKSGDKFYFYDSADSSMVKQYSKSFCYIDSSKFLQKFYNY